MQSIPIIHVWHDYVCPFCNVEATRIRRIKEADNLNLEVRFHPWPLETAKSTQPASTDEDKWVRLLRPLEPDAFAHWDPLSGFWPASSRLLFAGYEAALAQSTSLAEKFDLLVRQSIFRQPRPVDSIDALSELAAESDLDVAAFRAMLQDGSAEAPLQLAAVRATELGIRGIPTLVLPDGRSLIAPGIKVRRTAEGESIREDPGALREVLHEAAGMIPVASGHV